MSNNGAALLGGLLIGGLVVGAAMSAENAANRQQQRNMNRYARQQNRMLKQSTFCICGAQMVEGRIQQGVCKCNNLNCQRILTGQICYYCPKGANVQQHRQGFFYCQQCALQLRRQNNQVIQAKPAMQVKTVSQANAYPAQKPIAKKRGASIVKQGYMSKKGNWFNTAYKKRWFKLWTNKKMAYLTHPGASYTKGYADFTNIKKMEKKGKHGFEVTTSERVWSFLCSSTAERNSWFATIQSVCMGIQPQQPVVKYVPAPQPQVQYVSAPPQPQPQPQVQYAQPALPNNGNVPQNPYGQQQPMYRGSVIQQPQNIPQQQPTRPQSQSLQPGMVGYNVGDMYGNNNNNNLSQASAPSAPPLNNNNNMNYNNNNNNGNIKQQLWENDAPPPAYAIASAPPEDDIQPSAPPAEDENEGGYTGQ